MTFTYPSFLLIFLPTVTIIYFISKKNLRPLILLLSSIIFYLFTNLNFFFLLAFLTWCNYSLGKRIYKFIDQQKKSKQNLIFGILLNAIILLVYKFMDAYGPTVLLVSLPENLKEIISTYVLPLGISYITFQNISYLFDVYNQVEIPETNFLDFALYTLFFPKILVGPIMRYKDMKKEIKEPQTSSEHVYQGLRRVIIGLAKKILIADTIGRAINPSFNLDTPDFSAGIAWFMLIGYAVQLYYDFSGLTDMALGLGEIFGFRLVENFNYPFIAKSITEFWRRWHISLSSWVRNYIFTPLEFNRRRVKFARQQTNIIIAFFVMGIWHGLTPNFIVWGLFNGLILALEMTFLSKWLRKAWQPIQHVYTIAIFLISCVFLRSNSIDYGLNFLLRLFGSGGEITSLPFIQTNPLPIIDNTVWLALSVGILFSTPFLPNLLKNILTKTNNSTFNTFLTITYDVLLVCLFVVSLSAIVSTNTVGNIYAGF